MTALELPPDPTPSAPSRARAASLADTTGSTADTVFRLLAVAAGLLVLVILALITYSTTRSAWPAFTKHPTATQLTTMLADAGFERVDHRIADTSGHELHLFAAHLANDATIT